VHECNADFVASFEEVGSGLENIDVGEVKRPRSRQMSPMLYSSCIVGHLLTSKDLSDDSRHRLVAALSSGLARLYLGPMRVAEQMQLSKRLYVDSELSDDDQVPRPKEAVGPSFTFPSSLILSSGALRWTDGEKAERFEAVYGAVKSPEAF
jgi:hypothetical protein